mmetsp:Transcript_12979/g.26339  ORF Transcript_12979/g.26339 Transcript_12979/m.26339 type:complete len:89 (+) Transcript_12979:291-557(+)
MIASAGLVGLALETGAAGSLDGGDGVVHALTTTIIVPTLLHPSHQPSLLLSTQQRFLLVLLLLLRLRHVHLLGVLPRNILPPRNALQL